MVDVTDYRKYLDPKVLARISGLELRARTIVEGFFSGMHRSPYRGLSIEFADHRVYSQGDDIRHIDWKVFGRTDKYYIKEYEQETNFELMLVVDCSESMSYRSPLSPLSKHEYATAAAAAITYLALRQHDSVGLALFDEGLTQFVRPSSNAQHWKTIVHELAGSVGPASTSLGRVLHELGERLHHRMVIILISDLLDGSKVGRSKVKGRRPSTPDFRPSTFDLGLDHVDTILKGLRGLHYRHHELIVWQVCDRAELTFPFKGLTRFDGLEATGVLLTDPEARRARYLEEVKRFQSRLRTGCGRMHVDFAVFDTASPLDGVLSSYLAIRSARLRQRSSRVLGR